jgi:hypothetical protein
MGTNLGQTVDEFEVGRLQANFRINAWLTLLCGLTLIGLATWLRWVYLRNVSPHVDEYITMWAAQRTSETGAPLMPSGVIYPRGLPISYLIAGVGAVTGVSLTLGRVINLLFSVAAVGLTWLFGWRTWGAAVGLLAALGLALAPEAVQWGGSARFYAPMQCFALLTVWAAYLVMRSDEDVRIAVNRRTFGLLNLFFAITFVLALFSQEVTLFLYPPLGMAMVWRRGWRFLLRPAVLAAHLTCLLAIALRFVIDLVGQPGQLATFQRDRPYVSGLVDLPGAWSVYGPLLIGWDRLIWSIGVAVAIWVALMALWRVRGQITRLSKADEALLFFAAPTLFTLALLLTIAGGAWREERFFLAIQPMWLLVGSAGVVSLVHRLALRPAAFGPVISAIVLLSLGLGWSPVQKLLRDPGNGLDAALAYVAGHRQPGDVVLASQPSACAFVVGDCTYYARETGYAPYVIQSGGRLVDRYAGLPLLDSVANLETALRQAPTAWFVIERDSLVSSRFGQTYLDAVVEQFDLAFSERGGLALYAVGWRPPLTRQITVTFDPAAPYGPLLLSGWERSTATPGKPVAVTLFWRTAQRLADQVNTSVQIVPRDGAPLAQQDSPIARGLLNIEPGDFQPLPDPKVVALPGDLPGGRYRIDVAVYPASSAESFAPPLALDWFWVGEPPPPPTIGRMANWQNGLRLVGHDGLPPDLPNGDNLTVQLHWSTTRSLTTTLTRFTHLVGPDGQVVAQSDQQPEAGFYPTWGWDVGETVPDGVELAIPNELDAGVYQLRVGWYDAASGVRVRLADGSDAFELARWHVNGR